MKIVGLRYCMQLRVLLGLMHVLAVGGCGGDDSLRVYPVSGKVLVDGQPAAKARVTFHASSGPLAREIPFAETEADGTFCPSTRLTRDGAPAGEYTLTIVWPEIKIDRGEEIAGFDRLGGSYGNPRSSSLKVTVKEGENLLPPFELRSSAPLPPRASGAGDRGR